MDELAWPGETCRPSVPRHPTRGADGSAARAPWPRHLNAAAAREANRALGLRSGRGSRRRVVYSAASR
jgi:hypothetical protein